eukprot:TRINITY_DN24675_c0_g1_i2.p1 TRINITY_DN24675_c0_g1~~TRINITY_DN24675_c0_g1_i2.p1  ORF type:complete len:363 (+),score=64.33 TRINITY_DN24675_c0_g1_i2:44-1132(+)
MRTARVHVAFKAAVAAGCLSAALVTVQLIRRRRRSRCSELESPQLSQLASELQELLAARKPRWIEGITDELYQLPPFIPKAFWTALGDTLQPFERPEGQKVSGDRYITLRLDGSGFSKLTRRLCAAGVLSDGYSEEFADIMRECCRSLMAKLNAKCAYTQSDEMTVVVAPASVVRGEQQCHTSGGRVLKLCTHAASHVTALFNYRIQALFAAKGISMEESFLAAFDCRLGHYATLDEALALVLWRAADCGVNGVSDAVHKSRGKIADAKKVMGKSKEEKLQWLAANHMLPLKSHQAYGSYFVKVRRIREGINPQTGKTATSLRSTIEDVPGNVLCLAAARALFPKGDELQEPTLVDVVDSTT